MKKPTVTIELTLNELAAIQAMRMLFQNMMGSKLESVKINEYNVMMNPQIHDGFISLLS